MPAGLVDITWWWLHLKLLQIHKIKQKTAKSLNEDLENKLKTLSEWQKIITGYTTRWFYHGGKNWEINVKKLLPILERVLCCFAPCKELYTVAKYSKHALNKLHPSIRKLPWLHANFFSVSKCWSNSDNMLFMRLFIARIISYFHITIRLRG